MSQEQQLLVRQRDTILAINKLAIYGANFDSVMESVVEGILVVLPQANGAVVELCESDDMVYAAASGTMIPHLGLRLKRAGSLSGRCTAEENILYCVDSETDERVNREACRRVGLRSMIVAPLLYRKRCVGVLKVCSPEPDVFSDNDLLIVQTFVTMIAAGFGSVAEAQAMDMLQKFINTATHELRTPLTSLKGALDIMTGLHKMQMSHEVQQLLDIALRGSSRMMRLIDDLLTLGKIQSGDVNFFVHDQDLGKMLEDAIEGVISYRDNISFVLKKPPVGTKIKIDKHRFQQIMANLLSNAAKFSHEGGQVIVSTEIKSDKVITAVEDKGVGIPTNFHLKVFDQFAQAENQTHQGTGLGLHIAKDMVDKMKGHIWFQSQEGVGTTFFVEFALAK